MRPVIIGTAGHVDHGKTTLIRALTGTDTDRLAEEQARGMTIDLGFAHLELPGGIAAGIVDVPGHERFVKNMLAGAGGVDIALLVVAADEGPMPQTREHLDILSVLGVSRGVVALTRSDRADPDLIELVADETRAALKGTPLEGARFVPVCAPSGEGLDALVAALADAAQAVPEKPESAPVRLPVDRVFSLPGVGTVVTGTLVSGALRAGDPVELQPMGLSSKARTLQSHGRKVERAIAGMRVAVNLPGVEVAQLERGAVLCAPGALAETRLIDVRLRLLESASRPLKHRERVRLHLGAGEVLARVHLLDREEVAPGDDGVPAQIACETPIAPARGERFVLRRYSPARAIGGGVVVEPAPARRYRKGDSAALALFDSRAAGGDPDHLHAALAARHADRAPADLAAELGIDPARVDAAALALVAEGRAVALADGRLLSDAAAQRLRDTARRALADWHRKNPLRRAMPRDGLRTPLAKAADVRNYNALIEWLESDGVLVDDGVVGVRLPEHTVEVPPVWQKAAEEIRAVFDAAGMQPPSPGAFVYPRDIVVPTILNLLAERGELVRLTDDLFLSVSALESAKEAVRKLAETPEGITVGTVRDATGSSRKIILPLLEYLDAQRFTRRVGDNRILAR